MQREISYPLVCFPNAYNGEGCARLKQETRTWMQVSRVGDRDPRTWAITCCRLGYTVAGSWGPDCMVSKNRLMRLLDCFSLTLGHQSPGEIVLECFAHQACNKHFEQVWIKYVFFLHSIFPYYKVIVYPLLTPVCRGPYKPCRRKFVDWRQLCK